MQPQFRAGDFFHDCQHSKCRGDRAVSPAIRHVQLAAAAALAGELGKRRGKPRLAELHAGERQRVEFAREHKAVEPRRAEKLKGLRCAPAFGEVRALEDDLPGIDRRGGERRQIRRRQHPRQPRGVEPVGAPPALHRHDGELSFFRQEFFVEQLREFAGRHPVAQRNRIEPDE